jgi:hypothetical protein
MSGSISPHPNTPSWHGAHFERSTGTTIPLHLYPLQQATHGNRHFISIKSDKKCSFEECTIHFRIGFLVLYCNAWITP